VRRLISDAKRGALASDHRCAVWPVEGEAMSGLDPGTSDGLGTMQRLDDGQADAGLASYAVADELNAHDLDVLDLTSGSCHYLYVTNAPNAFSEIIISNHGHVSWEYRPFRSSRLGMAQLMGMVLDVLDASGDRRQTVTWRWRGHLLGAGADRAFRRCGMRVRRVENRCTRSARGLYRAEIVVTNPTRSERGRARLSDDDTIRWECRLSWPTPRTPGIDPGEFAATIATALARAAEGQRH